MSESAVQLITRYLRELRSFPFGDAQIDQVIELWRLKASTFEAVAIEQAAQGGDLDAAARSLGVVEETLRYVAELEQAKEFGATVA